MRAVVLGGAGGVGLAAARTLLDVGIEVTVADVSHERCERARARLDERVDAVTVDVTDRSRLDEVLSAHDIAVNTVGPFFRFGPAVLRAAIDVGVDYIDVCDDPEPTLEMLAFDAMARARGVTAVVGMGASPGVSNLLAVRSVDGLDGPIELITGWNIDGAQSVDEGSNGAAVVHGMQQVTGIIPVVEGSRRVDRRPLQPVHLDYPGLRTVTGRTFGHPEAVTLPLWDPRITDCVNVVTGREATLKTLAAVAWTIDRSILSPRRAATAAALIERFAPSSTMEMLSIGLPPIFAYARGVRDGVPVVQATALAHFPGFSMSTMTGIPLALGAAAMPGRPGVHTPETAFDPEDFFVRLAGFCPGSPPPRLMTVTTSSDRPVASNVADLRAASQFCAVLAH